MPSRSERPPSLPVETYSVYEFTPLELAQALNIDVGGTPVDKVWVENDKWRIQTQRVIPKREGEANGKPK